MKEKRSVAAPVAVAAVLLALPLLYVGSYLALAEPQCEFEQRWPTRYKSRCYRVGQHYAASVFWPLEQVDRHLRPDQFDIDY
jgi:hypothetical protein